MLVRKTVWVGTSNSMRCNSCQSVCCFIVGSIYGTWEGWLEFVPLDPALFSRRTERETTQPDLSALEYWATGLEPLYLAGAFERSM